MTSGRPSRSASSLPVQCTNVRCRSLLINQELLSSFLIVTETMCKTVEIILQDTHRADLHIICTHICRRWQREVGCIQRKTTHVDRFMKSPPSSQAFEPSAFRAAPTYCNGSSERGSMNRRTCSGFQGSSPPDGDATAAPGGTLACCSPAIPPRCVDSADVSIGCVRFTMSPVVASGVVAATTVAAVSSERTSCSVRTSASPRTSASCPRSRALVERRPAAYPSDVPSNSVTGRGRAV